MGIFLIIGGEQRYKESSSSAASDVDKRQTDYTILGHFAVRVCVVC